MARYMEPPRQSQHNYHHYKSLLMPTLRQFRSLYRPITNFQVRLRSRLRPNIVVLLMCPVRLVSIGLYKISPESAQRGTLGAGGRGTVNLYFTFFFFFLVVAV